MKQLLIYLLTLYYTDFRRSVLATLSRKVDATIRAAATNSTDLAQLVSYCKKQANAKKQKDRRNPVKPQHRRPHRLAYGKKFTFSNDPKSSILSDCGDRRRAKAQAAKQEAIRKAQK